MSKVRHRISLAQATAYTSLPGKSVTGAFLRQYGPVVMADAASSLESLLPCYEVISVDIEYGTSDQAEALIEYCPRIVLCDVCHHPYHGIPQWLVFAIGPRRFHCWCSPACQAILIERAQAETKQRRQEIGDLVKAGWMYLSQRLPIPPGIRAYMTDNEWNELLQHCNDKYICHRQALVAVFTARFGIIEQPPELILATPVQADLWEVEP